MDLTKAVWRKASRSTVQNDNCVEIAGVSATVAIRDSKDPNGPMLTMKRTDFKRFTEAIKNL
ncbi:DUF397 domain-containing protein [Actinomadura chokoriensis]|uniref:DUF397 domain-containing protein n=1 Tax=Actinomadura chokoriensis TaxID=454156 RepID=UPI0031F75988